MTAELAINSGAESVMPTVLMLLLGLGVSTLAAYIALDQMPIAIADAAPNSQRAPARVRGTRTRRARSSAT